jgi:hypothetical protein
VTVRGFQYALWDAGMIMVMVMMMMMMMMMMMVADEVMKRRF